MALPAGLKIGDAIQFVPTFFDVLIAHGQKIAGVITYTNSTTNTIGVILFPPNGIPVNRSNIKFSGDQTIGDPYFIMPTTGDELPEEEPEL